MKNKLFRIGAVMIAVAIVMAALGCGGGSTGTQPSPPPSTPSVGSGGGGGNTAVLVNLGDLAQMPHQIVSFELTIESLALRSANGDVSLLSTPRRFELSRLKAEPLLLANVAQGKYSGITVRVSDPKISFIDASGVLRQDVATVLTSSSATNPSEFFIGSTPQEINAHLFLTASFADSAVAVTPALNFSSTSIVPTHDLVGRIATVGSSSFSIDAGNGRVSFVSDSSTTFQGMTALSDLAAGMTVEVDVVLGSGGTLRATKVQLENDKASAVVVEGLALDLAPAQLQMVVREVHGPGDVTLPTVGKALMVNSDSSTQFQLEPDDVDLSNLDFTPTFNALTIAPGQNVRAVTISGGAASARHLRLAKQAVDGIAGAVTANSVSGQYSFPLNLPPDSAFAKMTGQSSVLVTVQPSTQKLLYFGLEDCVTCITTGSVRVRGLLFFSGGKYRLVAEWLAVTS